MLDEKSYEKTLVFDISCKTLKCAKPLLLFGKVDQYVRVHDGIRHLVLYGRKKMLPFTIGLDIL